MSHEGSEPERRPNPRLVQIAKQRMLDRYRWIETAIRLGESIDAKRYLDHFSVKRPVLSQDLQSFSEKVNWLGGSAERKHGTVVVEEWPPAGCAGVFSPLEWHRLQSPETVMTIEVKQIVTPRSEIQDRISSAIRGRMALRLTYNSTTTGNRSALISPHHIVHAIGRSHVRAYDHDRNAFRDFVLVRMDRVLTATDITYVSDDTDKDWHDVIEVHLRITQALEEEKRRAIALGVGLTTTDDVVSFTCKRCVVDYELLARGIRPDHYKQYFDVEIANPSIFDEFIRH